MLLKSPLIYCKICSTNKNIVKKINKVWKNYSHSSRLFPYSGSFLQISQGLISVQKPALNIQLFLILPKPEREIWDLVRNISSPSEESNEQKYATVDARGEENDDKYFRRWTAKCLREGTWMDWRQSVLHHIHMLENSIFVFSPCFFAFSFWFLLCFILHGFVVVLSICAHDVTNTGDLPTKPDTKSRLKLVSENYSILCTVYRAFHLMSPPGNYWLYEGVVFAEQRYLFV